jgi:hypothetical protein
MKKVTKKAAISIIILLSSIIIGLMLLLIVYSLPTNKMLANTLRSYEIYQYEGTTPQLVRGYSYSQLDNYTDALMLLMAIKDKDIPLLDEVLLSYHDAYHDKANDQAIVLMAQGVTDGLFELSYPRYWHGYLVWLKPLLLFFSVADIRIFNMILQLTVFFCLLLLSIKKLGMKHSVPLFFTILVLNPVTLALSFQFSSIFYIAFISAIVMLISNDKLNDKNLYTYLFLIIGILVAYFDFFTYPAVAFGIPAAYYVLLNCKDKPIVQSFKNLIIYGINWVLGYLIMWGGKWLLVSLFTDFSSFSDAINEILLRTSSPEETESATNALSSTVANIKIFMEWPFVLCALAFILVIIALVLKKKIVIRFNIKIAIPLIAISLISFLWLFVVSNHSYVHAWFTFRELAIFAFGITSMIINSIYKYTEAAD